MSPDLLTLLGIILAGGALGGLVGAFLSEDETTISFCLKRMVIGIGCAFIVPLFLNMISSTLLKQTTEEPIAYFVFGGFCVIAAISSKGFISSVSDRILQQVKEVKAEVKEAAALADASIENQTEPEEPATRALVLAPKLRPLSTAQYTILRALGANSKYTMRTFGGICKDSGLDPSLVGGHLGYLQSLGLVAKVTRKGKRDLWHLTQEGKAQLAEEPTVVEDGD